MSGGVEGGFGGPGGGIGRDGEVGAAETEQRAAALADLDLRPTVEVVRAVVRGHHDVLTAVEATEPGLEPGAPADVVVLDDNLEIERVLVGGGERVAR